MGDKLADPDYSFDAVIESIVHELFHAYQDFSGVDGAAKVSREPDAYIFASIFGRQYNIPSEYYNRLAYANPETDDQIKFKTAWDNFFNNDNYSKEDYRGIFENFVKGSTLGSLYKAKNVSVTKGKYLIYNLLKK